MSDNRTPIAPRQCEPLTREQQFLWDLIIRQLSHPPVKVFLYGSPEKLYKGRKGTSLVDVPRCPQNQHISLSSGLYIKATLPVRLDKKNLVTGCDQWIDVPVEGIIMDVADVEEGQVIWEVATPAQGTQKLFIRAPRHLCSLDYAENHHYEERQIELENKAAQRAHQEYLLHTYHSFPVDVPSRESSEMYHPPPLSEVANRRVSPSPLLLPTTQDADRTSPSFVRRVKRAISHPFLRLPIRPLTGPSSAPPASPSQRALPPSPLTHLPDSRRF